MKKLYITAEALAKLATLAADAGTLAYQFATLRVDIIKKHEERQRNEI